MPDSPKVWPTADVHQMHAARNLVPMTTRGSWSGGAREEGRGQGRMEEKEEEWLWSSGSARRRRPLACFSMSVRHDYLDMVRTGFPSAAYGISFLSACCSLVWFDSVGFCHVTN